MTKQSVELSRFLKDSRWIWLPQTNNLNQYGDFRAVFSLTEPADTKLYISADSHYAVYLNGALLPAAQYPDYPNYKVVDVLDISTWVRPGENVLAVVGYHQGEDSSVYRLGDPGLLFGREKNRFYIATRPFCAAPVPLIAAVRWSAFPDSFLFPSAIGRQGRMAGKKAAIKWVRIGFPSG